MINYFWIFLGGGLGSICRFLVSDLLKMQSGLFPWGTLVANLISSFILGVLVGLNLKTNLSTPYRLIFMTGFCGGFSTFSTFSAEAFQLLQDGKITIAFYYVLASLIAGLIAVMIGIKIVV